MNMVYFWRLFGGALLLSAVVLAFTVHPALLLCSVFALWAGIGPVEIERTNHAEDLGTIAVQEDFEKVYVSARNDLTDTLNKFKFPKNAALMSNDSPVSTLTEALSRVERDLSQSRTKAIRAKARIAARKANGWQSLVDP